MRENRDPRSVFLWEAVCHTRHCTLKSCLAVTCPGEKKKKKARLTLTWTCLSLSHTIGLEKECAICGCWPYGDPGEVTWIWVPYLTGSNLHTVDNHCVPCNVSNTCWLVHLQIFWLVWCLHSMSSIVHVVSALSNWSCTLFVYRVFGQVCWLYKFSVIVVVCNVSCL